MIGHNRNCSASRAWPPAATVLAHHRGQRRPRRVTTHPEPRRIDAQLVRMCGDPLGRVATIGDGRGKRIFRRQPVVDRQQHAAAGVAQRAADRIVCVEAAGHQAAAVEIDQRRALARHRRLTRADRCAASAAARIGPGSVRSSILPMRLCGAGETHQLTAARYAARSPSERAHSEDSGPPACPETAWRADRAAWQEVRKPAPAARSPATARRPRHDSQNSATARRSMPKATQPVWATAPALS